jgi:hypothetical protein
MDICDQEKEGEDQLVWLSERWGSAAYNQKKETSYIEHKEARITGHIVCRTAF